MALHTFATCHGISQNDSTLVENFFQVKSLPNLSSTTVNDLQSCSYSRQQPPGQTGLPPLSHMETNDDLEDALPT